MIGNSRVTPEILVKFNLKINLQIYVILLSCIFKATFKKKKKKDRQILLIIYFLVKHRTHEDVFLGLERKKEELQDLLLHISFSSQLQLCYRYMLQHYISVKLLITMFGTVAWTWPTLWGMKASRGSWDSFVLMRWSLNRKDYFPTNFKNYFVSSPKTWTQLKNNYFTPDKLSSQGVFILLLKETTC